MITTFLITYGAMMIPIGFTLYGIYYLAPDHNLALLVLADLGFAAGLVAFAMAIRRGYREDKDAKQRHKELLAELKGLRSDLSHKGGGHR